MLKPSKPYSFRRIWAFRPFQLSPAMFANSRPDNHRLFTVRARSMCLGTWLLRLTRPAGYGSINDVGWNGYHEKDEPCCKNRYQMKNYKYYVPHFLRPPVFMNSTPSAKVPFFLACSFSRRYIKNCHSGATMGPAERPGSDYKFVIDFLIRLAVKTQL